MPIQFRPIFRSIVVAICGLALLQFGASPAFGQTDLADLLFQGSDFHYSGDLKQAAAMFQKVLQQDPTNEFALNQMGLVQAKQENFAQALKAFEQVRQHYPDNTFARVWIGVLLLRENQRDRAYREFQQTLQIDPRNANAWYFLGVIYAVEHNLAQAVTHLRQAQEVGSNDPETYYRLALAFTGLDMPHNAQLAYEKALELNPRHTRSLNALGWLLFNQGSKASALQTWQKVLGINPQDPEAGFNLAKVYNDDALAAFRAGQKAEARKLWEKTLAHEPGNRAAKYYLQKVQ